jgi:hypothetical protein
VGARILRVAGALVALAVVVVVLFTWVFPAVEARLVDDPVLPAPASPTGD